MSRGTRDATSDVEPPESCPRCQKRQVIAQGRARSSVDWYICRPCGHVWAVRPPTVTVPAQPRPDTAASQKHVLVVDDDSAVLSIVERALTGYRISPVRDPGDALIILSTNERIDLLITDYLMPSMSGDELVGRAKEMRPALLVLVLTGHGLAIASNDAAWWASVPHVNKPFTINGLRSVVEQLIGSPA